MKTKEFSYFKLFIYALILIVAVESFLILRSVFDIKSGNYKLKAQLEELQKKNSGLEQENKELKLRIEDFQEPKVAPPEVPEGYKVFRNLDFGYEISYPSDHKITLSSGHSPLVNPDQDQKLTVYTKDSYYWVDINSISLTKYKSLSEYIKGFYSYKIYVKETIVVGNNKYDIYKMSGEQHYHVLLKGRNYIFDIGSSSEEMIKRVIAGFKFI